MRFETISLGIAGPPGPASTVPGPQGPEGPQGIPGPPGGESGSVNGVSSLRGIAPVNGQTLHLNYHTAAGDLGGGDFRGVTGAAAGAYVDNDGTVIVPTGGDGSAAWLRVWDGIECHVGWFGAKCDHIADDYAAIVKTLSLFSNGRGSVGGYTDGVTPYGFNAVINFGPGCNFAQPLYIVADGGFSIRLKGTLGQAGHIRMASWLAYTGPAVYAAITFQACDSGMEDLNVYPGLAYNGVHATSDNTINTTTTHAITAGQNVVVTPAAMTYIQVDCAIMIDDGGPNLEIVYVSTVTATTFTADFRKNHASGVKVGHGPYSSGLRFRRCIFTTPYGPVPLNTILASPISPGTDVLLTTNQPHNIRVGMPIRIDSKSDGQTVYAKTVPSTTTFTVGQITIPHAAGVQVKYASAGFLMGNKPLGTVQVSEVAFETVTFRGDTPGYYPHSGFRQNQGGNVKNVVFNDIRYSYLDIAFEATGASGIYTVNGCIGGCNECVFVTGLGTWTVSGLEDESDGARILMGGAGANYCSFTLIGASVEYRMHTDDFMVFYGGAFTAIGGNFTNSRTSTSYCKVSSLWDYPQYSSSVTLIGCYFPNAVEDSVIVWDGGTPCIPGIQNNSKVTILNCLGGPLGMGAQVSLRNILPPDSFGEVNGIAELRAMPTPPYIGGGRRTLHLNWLTTPGDGGGGDFVGQLGSGYVDDGNTVIVPTGGDGSSAWLRTNYLQKTATYDPASIAAAAVGTVQTMTVGGAALGDIVEASFSLDLQGVGINAWVSAADTVSYQFRNPTAAPIDLGSGTVKCRVKK